MFVYFAILLLICLDFEIEKLLLKYELFTINGETKKDKILTFCFKYRIITILTFVFFSTFKSLQVGLDTYAYYEYYEGLKRGTIELYTPISNPFEILSTFLFGFCSIFRLDIRFLFFIVSVFVSISFVLFVNKFSTNKLMSLLLYVMLGIFAQSLSAMRQIIAMALILIALINLYNKKWFISLLFILLASTFHISALCCLILIPLRFLKCNWILVLFGIFLSIVVGFLFPTILKIVEVLTPLDYYTKYMVNFKGFIQEPDIRDILYSVSLMMIFIVFYISFKKFLILDNEKRDRFNFFLNIYFIVPLIRITGMITNMQALFNRLSMYFFIALIILIPMFVSNFYKKENKWKVLLNVAVYIVAINYMYYLYCIKLSCGVVPFIFWF